MTRDYMRLIHSACPTHTLLTKLKYSQFIQAMIVNAHLIQREFNEKKCVELLNLNLLRLSNLLNKYQYLK